MTVLDSGDSVVVERDVPRHDAASASFLGVLDAVGADARLLATAAGDITGKGQTGDAGRGAGPKGLTRAGVRALGTMTVVLVRSDLPLVVTGSGSVFRDAPERPKLEMMRGFVERVARFVALSGGRAPAPAPEADADGAAAPARRSAEVMERWKGTVFEVDGDSVWARLHNEDDDRDEDIELLPADFDEADRTAVRPGTALSWRFESWADAQGVRHTRSKVEVLRPAAPDPAIVTAYSSAWQRAAVS